MLHQLQVIELACLLCLKCWSQLFEAWIPEWITDNRFTQYLCTAQFCPSFEQLSPDVLLKKTRVLHLYICIKVVWFSHDVITHASICFVSCFVKPNWKLCFCFSCGRCTFRCYHPCVQQKNWLKTSSPPVATFLVTSTIAVSTRG